MRNLTVFLGAMVILIMAAGTIQAQEVKIGPWVKVNERDGISGYTRTNSRSSFKEFRAVGVIDAPIAVLESILRDNDGVKGVFFKAKKIEAVDVPGYKTTQDTRYIYMVQAALWPIEDRDGVGRLDFYITKPANTVTVRMRLVMPEYPKAKGVTRLEMCEVEFILKPIDATHTEVTYQNLFRAGGAVDKMPALVVNQGLKIFGVSTVKCMRELAKEEKYKNAKTIITQTPLGDS